MKVRRRKVPPIVGHKEATEILGVRKQNLLKVPGLPPALQARDIAGFAVSSGSLWPRAEIEELAEKRAERS